MSAEHEPGEPAPSSITARSIVGVVVLVGFIAFVLQNTGDVQVDWLVFEFTVPLYLLIVTSAVVGAVLYAVFGWSRRRRRRKRD